MKMNAKNVALAILMSLGLAACSSGTGSNASSGTTASSASTTAASYDSSSSSVTTGSISSATSTSTGTDSSTSSSSSTDSTSTDNSSTESTTETTSTDSTATETTTETTSTDSTATETTTESTSTDSTVTESTTDTTSTDSTATETTIESTSTDSTATETTTESASTDSTSTETTTDTASTETTTDETTTSGTVNASSLTSSGAIVASTSPLNTDSSSQVYAVLNDETAQQSLLTAYDSLTNTTTTCSNSSGSACSGANVATGTVMMGYKNAYSGYAVIRETYANENEPANSFVAVVSTPTTDKNVITDATYTGYSAYSRKNAANVLTRDFTMTVSDDTVSGSVYTTATNGNTTTWVTLEDGSISVNDDSVSFSGTASFASSLSSQSGTYEGYFAGANAEEVVGTYSTVSSTDDDSVQGAFAGSK